MCVCVCVCVCVSLYVCVCVCIVGIEESVLRLAFMKGKRGKGERERVTRANWPRQMPVAALLKANRA